MAEPLPPSKLAQAVSEAGYGELGDALDLLRLIWTIEHNLQLVSRELEHRHGVTGPQLAVLRYVGIFPGITPTKLADLLQLDPSTLSGVFRRLTSRGALEKRPDPADGRRAFLHPTPLGQQLAHAAGGVESALVRALARLPVEAVRASEQVLQVFAEELEREVGGPPGPPADAP